MIDCAGVIGSVVGKYRIAEKIGEGGMGSVFRAEHTRIANRSTASSSVVDSVA